MSAVQRLNHKDYLSVTDDALYYFEITGAERGAKEAESAAEKFTEWSDKPIDYKGFKILPFGEQNDIPQRIQEKVMPNSLAPRLQNRKIELLFEQGPYLYRQVKDGRKYFREPIENPQIEDWLRAIDHESLLLKNATDYFYLNEVFNLYRRELGARLNMGGVGVVDHVSAYDCRLAYRSTDKRKTPTHVLVTNWEDYHNSEIKVYPLFDRKEPAKKPLAMHYSKFHTFGMKDYPIPEIYGALDWIERSTTVPKLFKALTENALNIKWHIQSPAAYWDQKRKELKDNCANSNPPVHYKEQMLADLKQEILNKLSTLLSGVDNVGKFWHNEYVVQMIGANAVEMGWKITAIEQKIQEYVEAQLKISEKADFATVAGLGLHSALGNVGADGKSDSGSEQLYALKIHQLTSTQVPEYYITKAINDCIAIKFDPTVKCGFYRINPEREQDVTQSQRTVNQTPSITQ